MQDRFNRRGMRLFMGWIVLSCVCMAAYADDGDDSATWGSDQPAAGDDVQWGQSGGDLYIPTRDQVVLGPTGCPVIIVGNTVWDVEAAMPRDALLEGELPRNAKFAINPEGTLFAAVTSGGSNEPSSVSIWSTQSGERIKDFIFPGSMVQYIGLADENQLILMTRDEQVHVYDPQTGKPRGTIDLPDQPYGNLTAIMSNGRYMAVGTTQATLVLNIGNGRRVATMRQPPDEPQEPGAPRVQAQQGRSRRATIPGRGASTINANMRLGARALAFSPDGRELVCAGRHDGNLRIVVWNTRGTVVLDQVIRGLGGAGFVDSITWSPDGKAWLIDAQHVVDRDTGLVLVDVGRNEAARFVDRERLLLHNNSSGVTVVKLPWDAIDATLTAYKRNEDALLAPGSGAAASIDIIDARGNAGQTQTRLMDAIRERFEQSNIELREHAPVTLHIRMAEQAGDELKIYESESPFDFFGKDTGRTATEAEATLVAQMWIAGDSQPIWSTETSRSSSRRFEVAINNASVRDSMVENVERWIKGLPLPSYIPANPELAVLPVYMD